jgi:hypothetical protein
MVGPEHPRMLRTRRSLARVVFSLGRLDEAMVSATAVLAVEEQMLGAEHPEAAATRRLLESINGGADGGSDGVQAPRM